MRTDPDSAKPKTESRFESSGVGGPTGVGLSQAYAREDVERHSPDAAGHGVDGLHEDRRSTYLERDLQQLASIDGLVEFRNRHGDSVKGSTRRRVRARTAARAATVRAEPQARLRSRPRAGKPPGRWSR